MARHIIIGRRSAGVPSAYGRVDFDGLRWHGEDLRRDSGLRGTTVQTNLRALIDDALREMGEGVNFTVSPRCINDFIARGNPDFGLAAGYTAELLLPLGRADAPHESELFTPIFWAPAEGIRRVLRDKAFAKKTLLTELRARFTDADIADRCQAHCRRELWLRHDFSARDFCPDQVPAYIAPATDDSAEKDRQQRIQQKQRGERVKAASRKSAEASAADKAAASEYAERQQRARQAASKKSPN